MLLDIVMLSSRGFQNAERETYRNQGGIYLIAEGGYNYSGFSDKTARSFFQLVVNLLSTPSLARA